MYTNQYLTQNTLKYGMCMYGANFNLNVDKYLTSICLSSCASSPTMCFYTKHLSTLNTQPQIKLHLIPAAQYRNETTEQ
jgi:hypothetical protein